MIIRNKDDKLIQIDKYKILSRLGKGGFGTVYKVQDRDSKKEYALKLMHNVFNLKRIREQLEVLKILNTSTVFLKTFYSKKVGNGFFILMEYIDSPNLEKLVQKSLYSESDAIRVILDILDSLEFLHVHNIIHGDIKAENILRSEDRFYLIDFDIVKRGSKVKTVHIQNDDDFTAPEIYRGLQKVSSDIYSLGCTLYYLLTAQHIYGFTQDHDFSQKMFAHLYSETTYNENISQEMLYLIKRMTDKNPESRADISEIRGIINDR